MAPVLLFLALLPAFYGVLVMGDFSQYLCKPTRRQVRSVPTNRRYLVGAGLLLWLAGALWHLLVTPTGL